MGTSIVIIRCRRLPHAARQKSEALYVKTGNAKAKPSHPANVWNQGPLELSNPK
jgi:hypothetical protein